jgi:hypothetical protein
MNQRRVWGTRSAVIAEEIQKLNQEKNLNGGFGLALDLAFDAAGAAAFY